MQTPKFWTTAISLFLVSGLSACADDSTGASDKLSADGGSVAVEPIFRPAVIASELVGNATMRDVLCRAKAVASKGTNADAPSGGECTVRADGVRLRVKIDGGPTLPFRVTQAGERLDARVSDSWGDAQASAVPGFVSRFSSAYLVKDVGGPLCATLEYQSDDGQSDSLFIHAMPDFTADTVVVQDRSGNTASTDLRFSPETVAGFHVAVVTPREAQLRVGAVTFGRCDSEN